MTCWVRWARMACVAGWLIGSFVMCGCEPTASISPEDYVGPANRALSGQTSPVTATTYPATTRLTSRPATTMPATTLPATTSAPSGKAVTISEAILMAVENNRTFLVERYQPSITRTSVDVARSAFDPDLTGNVQTTRVETANFTGGQVNKGLQSNVDLSEFLPMGTTIDLGASTNIVSGANPTAVSRAGISVTQALLRGFGTDVNLATLRQTKIDVQTSQYELRGQALSLVAQTEEGYWDYALALRQIQIVVSSLEVAQKQLDETFERVKVGKVAETEMAAAKAEVAVRQENLIDARSFAERTRINLLRLIGPPDTDLGNTSLNFVDEPAVPQVAMDNVEDYIALAMKMRPDINQAKLSIKRDDLELVKTRNGLLPQMNAFVTLGRTGFARSFGDSIGNPADHGSDVLVGMSMEYPPLNREAMAVDRRALLNRQQAQEALGNVEQLAELDVRTAYIEVQRSYQQVLATAVTLELQEVTLRTEMAKFDVGKSTSLLVAQAERDLLTAQINEIQVEVGYLKSLVELYRLDGSLLERRGLVAPGADPITLNWKQPSTRNPAP